MVDISARSILTSFILATRGCGFSSKKEAPTSGEPGPPCRRGSDNVPADFTLMGTIRLGYSAAQFWLGFMYANGIGARVRFASTVSLQTIEFAGRAA
jgi:hypothetical protein